MTNPFCMSHGLLEPPSWKQFPLYVRHISHSAVFWTYFAPKDTLFLQQPYRHHHNGCLQHVFDDDGNATRRWKIISNPKRPPKYPWSNSRRKGLDWTRRFARECCMSTEEGDHYRCGTRRVVGGEILMIFNLGRFSQANSPWPHRALASVLRAKSVISRSGRWQLSSEERLTSRNKLDRKWAPIGSNLYLSRNLHPSSSPLVQLQSLWHIDSEFSLLYSSRWLTRVRLFTLQTPKFSYERSHARRWRERSQHLPLFFRSPAWPYLPNRVCFSS